MLGVVDLIGNPCWCSFDCNCLMVSCFLELCNMRFFMDIESESAPVVIGSARPFGLALAVPLDHVVPVGPARRLLSRLSSEVSVVGKPFKR